MKLEYMVVSPTTSLLNAFLRLFQAYYALRNGSYSSVSPSPYDVLAPHCTVGLHGCLTCRSGAATAR